MKYVYTVITTAARNRTYGARYVVASLALLVIFNTARADGLSLQLETGIVSMSSAPDDFWYEAALKHDTDFQTIAFGAGLRYVTHGLQLTVGWRNLGNEHQNSDIISDAAYFACRAKPSTCPPAVSFWTETGDEQQTYAELGYAFRLPYGLKLVPSVGIAETRITSHVNFFDPTVRGGSDFTKLRNEPCTAAPTSVPKMFGGLTLQHGSLGVGVEYLNTQPNRGANKCSSPFQGSSAEYLRLTYNFNL